MREKEKSRPGEATPKRAAGAAAYGRAAVPKIDFTTAAAGRQHGFIESLLLPGPENGLTLKDLVRITQWPERAVRKEIESERRSGALIVSDNRNGYYLADSPAEALRFARSMRGRALEIMKTARAVEKSAGGGGEWEDPA